jgi:uracil-DNA glycosylase
VSKKLINEIKACTVCKEYLPFPPKPVFSFSTRSKILLVGQAPGTKVHETGIPWNDPSGERLRAWLNVSKDDFYNPLNFAIVPMGFCYPGNAGKGDLPPRPECAELWMQRILKTLKRKELVLLIGQYSQKYFLQDTARKTLTETVKHWQEYLPDYFVLPHPSPRNNIWLRKNPWFERDVLPALENTIHRIL